MILPCSFFYNKPSFTLFFLIKENCGQTKKFNAKTVLNTIFGYQNFNRKFKNKFNFCLWRLFCCWHNQVCRCMFVSRRKKNAFALLKFYLFINGVLHACDRRCNLEKKEWLDLIITLWGAWDRDRCDLQWLCRRLESFWTFILAINMTDWPRSMWDSYLWAFCKNKNKPHQQCEI